MLFIHDKTLIDDAAGVIGPVREHEPSLEAFTQAWRDCRVAGDIVRLSATVFAMRDADGDLHFWETF